MIQSGEPKLDSAARVIAGLAERWRQFVDLEKRLDDMSKYGIDMQVACLHNRIEPTRFLLPPSKELGLCRIANDTMASVAEKSRGKIVCLGTAPLHALNEGGVEEMHRAVKELGLKGFMVLTNVGGVPIDNFKEFWRVAKDLDAVVYLHPTDPYQTSCRSYEDEYDLAHVIGWPFETTLILLRLVLSGMMDELDGLRILAHHAGGMVPFFMGRILESYSPNMTIVRRDQIEKARIRANLHEAFRKLFYYDTAVGGSAEALRCAYEVFGGERLLFATDYPYGPNGGEIRLSTYPKVLNSLNLSNDVEEAILHLNAEKFLRIFK